MPSGGLIPDRLLKLPFVWKAPRCRASTTRAKAAGCGSAQETIGGTGDGRSHRPQHQKKPRKTRAKPLAACPTPLRCHQLVLGASKGRTQLEEPLQSFAPGAGRGRALSAAPRTHFLPSGASRAPRLAPPANFSRELSLNPKRSFHIHRLSCFSVVESSLLTRVLGKRQEFPQPGSARAEMDGESWRYSWCQYLRLAVPWVRVLFVGITGI